MSIVEFIVILCIIAVPIIGLTGYFIFKITGLILHQRSVERLYLERVAMMRSRSQG